LERTNPFWGNKATTRLQRSYNKAQENCQTIQVQQNKTAVFEKVGEWWLGYVEELPGANTQGRTMDEARDNLREAVQLIIEANRQIGKDLGISPIK